MKRQHMYEIVKGYDEMPDLGTASTAKFDYFADKNADIARREIKHREAALKPSDEWMALEREREEISKKYAVKDAAGKFVCETRTGQNGRPQLFYTFPDDPAVTAAREAENAALNESRRDVIVARQKAIDDFNVMMDEEMPEEELKMFHRIRKDHMPALGKALFAVWSPLVDE